MKKKLLAIGLAVAVLAVTIVGMSIAYFTATDQETNVFTVGGVKVQLIERQRNADSSALVPFEQNKVLMPIVGSAQGEKDEWGLPTAANYVDKVITIKIPVLPMPLSGHTSRFPPLSMMVMKPSMPV